MIKKDQYYLFEIFPSSLTQAVSTRALGDMTHKAKAKRQKNQQEFLKALGLKKKKIVTMEQVHGQQIKILKASPQKEVKKTDGLVTQSKNLILAVKSADCLPLIAFHPQSQTLGVAHAGWKGIIQMIGQNLIQTMVKLGAQPDQILVGLGPHIGPCCYLVQPERTAHFQSLFGPLPGMIRSQKDGAHLDLVLPMIDQLLQTGVKRKNLEASQICTSCQNQEFFSFRQEGQGVGEFLTLATLEKNR